jgi:hypothetical protein
MDSISRKCAKNSRANWWIHGRKECMIPLTHPVTLGIESRWSKTCYHLEFYKFKKSIVHIYRLHKRASHYYTLEAWRSGHGIRLRSRIPGFEPRHGIRFKGKFAIVLRIIDLILMHCLCFYLTNKGVIVHNLQKKIIFVHAFLHSDEYLAIVTAN